MKIDNEKEYKLNRSLKVRYMNMIVIGGFIGIGFFFVSGSVVSIVGLGGVLFVYIIMGIVVYLLMMFFGEMLILLFILGLFEIYVIRFVDFVLGFVFGWNYWFCWVIGVVVELVVGLFIVKFWFFDINGIMWSIIFLVIIFVLNFLLVKVYGESEYWFVSIKVIIIIIFIIVGVLMIIGILGNGFLGFSNWGLLDGNGNKGFFIGGLLGIVNVFLVVGFFFFGIEIVGLVVGELENL